MRKIFAIMLILAFVFVGVNNCSSGSTSASITITNSSALKGVENVAFTVTLQVSNGSTPYTWQKTSGNFPAGIDINSSTGQIFGTPTATGLSTFTIKVTDSASKTATKTFTFGVGSAAGVVDVTTASLPNGTQNAAYNSSLAAVNGVQPYKWTISLGNLPAGLTLNQTTGAITGTPTTIGTKNITVKVTDAIKDTDTASLSITIVAPGGVTNPSNGTGGTYPGAQNRTVTVGALGAQKYYLYLPNSYTPATAIPLMIAFHGAAGAGNADTYAQDCRDYWGQVGYSENFMVVAPVATDAGTGSWILADTRAILTEIITDVLAAYNVEQEKIYGWGFSAGGSLMHCLGIERANFFAAYGVTAGSIDVIARPEGVTPATAAKKIPVSLTIGTSDPMIQTVKDDRDEFIAEGWVLNTDVFYSEFLGGHTFTVQVLQQVWYNVENFTLN